MKAKVDSWKKTAVSILIFTMFFTLMMNDTVFAAGLNKDQKRRAEQLTSIFENG
ncbi:chitosanase, partial [Bacillus atrophaeus]|nr:chitosanase [Bacillus atrophaeus]